jgi:hypothetical protein
MISYLPARYICRVCAFKIGALSGVVDKEDVWKRLERISQQAKQIHIQEAWTWGHTPSDNYYTSPNTSDSNNIYRFPTTSGVSYNMRTRHNTWSL